MGVVYLAEQDEPVRREVALKVLRAGADTREIVARFETERQALAVMEHPNITRVYDAGATESGLPYFVMERVIGVPITEYAATHRLDTRQRVKLIVQVCRAVQHAHQKGIIHRDIKPSNVLVTEMDGVPVCKVIDFGIAKATAPTAASVRLTATGMLVGTPAYMSPEQFEGDGTDIDTRTDIYSLGLLLFELVAGVLPFDPVAHAGWRMVIAKQTSGDVPAPSYQFGALPLPKRIALAAERRTDPDSLRRVISGDLDSVILKTLENDRERRYATANGVAADLEHFLAYEPVSARPASATYRMRKFARRHRAPVALATTLFAVLAIVAVGATIQARRLAVARASAVARQGQAEELIGFMLGDLRDRLQPIGKLDLLDDVGRRALAYFAAVPEADLSDAEQFRRSLAVQQLGDVRRLQGRLAEADTLMRQSIALVTPLAARDSLNPDWQLGLAHSHYYAGLVDWERGNVDAALAHWAPFVRISYRLMSRYPDSLAYRAELAYALNNIGFATEANGDAAGALSSYSSALAIMDPLVHRDTITNWVISLAALHNAAGVARRKTGDLAGSLRDHQAELAIKQGLLKRDATNRDWQRYVGIAHAYLGEILLWTGDARGAVTESAAARAIYASLVARDTTNVGWRIGLVSMSRRTGVALLEANDAATALKELDGTRAMLVRLAHANAANPSYQRELSATGTARGRALLRLGRTAEARQAITESITTAETSLTKKPTDLERRKLVADGYLVLGEAQSRPADGSGATTAWAHTLVLVDSLARTKKETEFLALQASAMLHLGGGADARPVVAELLKRGYRRPSFLELVRAKGLPAN
jgi:tetratricopeptide (TPR) repeat protein